MRAGVRRRRRGGSDSSNGVTGSSLGNSLGVLIAPAECSSGLAPPRRSVGSRERRDRRRSSGPRGRSR
jgi:hypothetical protein